MAIDYDPFCCTCGGPFSHVELLDSAELGEDDRYLMNVVYDSQVLSPAQSAWIRLFQVISKTANFGTRLGMHQSSDADVFISAKGEWRYGEDWEINAPTWADKTGGNGESHRDTTNGPFFPLHSTCLTLLQKYMQCQSNVGSSQPPMTISNFIDAYTARQEYCSKIHSVAWQSGQQARLPPGYPWYGSVDWSHLYFGARRYWANPWDCEPGMEYLCADPILEPQTEQFISTCLAYPQSDRQRQCSPSSQLQLSEILLNASPLLYFPREVLALIASYLPLQSALNLHATSRRISCRLPSTDTMFWRFYTLQLHGSWFWELHNPSRSSSNANWKALLQVLTMTRREIIAGATPYWYNKSAIEDCETRNRGDGDAATAIKAAAPLPSLPLGLKNRQRIWMCLECVGMNGHQRRLVGLADEETVEQIQNSG